MMPGLCCVPGCNGRGGHRFPSKPELRNRWLQAVRRGEPNWRPSRWTTVCRAHFMESDYITLTREKHSVERWVLRSSVVPTVFSWKPPKNKTAEERSERLMRREKDLEKRERERLAALDVVQMEVEVGECTDEETELDALIESNESASGSVNVATQTTTRMASSAEDYLFDSDRFQFYTGLQNHETFMHIFYTFGETAYELNYYYTVIPPLSAEDQFYLTLMKLRLARTNYELAGMFGINERDVSNIFITWVNFLNVHFRDIDWWPQRELVRFFCPSDFKEQYPTTRVTIDSTEIPIQKPHEPILQQGTYSTYKNRNTAKVLVGATPGGLVCYVSQVYGGGASDRQICERSCLFDKCDPGDSIMADKGFNVQDMFVPYQVQVNIPEFFKKKNRMSGKSVLKDRKIASKRVHIERIIGLAKTFKILKQPLNNTESCLADAIISVCFYLCNFRPAIVSTKA